MAPAHTTEIATAGDRDIVFTRSFGAPRALVFDAWTKPELVRRWLPGPPGWTMPVCEIDLRVGGRHRCVWCRADGVEMGMGGVHLEVVVPERVVCTQFLDEDWTGGEAVGTLEFAERGGVTIVRNTVRYASAEARAAVRRSGATQGMETSYQALDEVLATMGGVRAVGGLFDLEGPSTPPRWVTYFTVRDADETARSAAELGGKVTVPRADVAGVGRFCGITSPQGVAFRDLARSN